MIKNDRQYRMTKAHVRTFADAIEGMRSAPVPEGADPTIRDVQRRALQSQVEELSSELKEYEALRAGNVTSFEAASLSDLPLLLVKARIARGQTQRELAERLNVKEQQVQRWEGNEFHGASLDTLRAVADALGVALRQEMFIPSARVTPKDFLLSLEKLGLSSEFVLKRIVPSPVASLFRDEVAGLKEIVSAAGGLGRVFGIQVSDLVEMKAQKMSVSAVAVTRFKLPARAKRAAVDAYTVYAHYLSALLADCVEVETVRSPPASYHDFHLAVTAPGSPMSFEAVVRLLWDCGTIVLPLHDAGGFHGAVWKIKGRFVIVLKQTTQLESRWLYDALHEWGHIENGDVTEDIAHVEEQEISPENSGKQEEAANEWAENALFDGRSEEIEATCTAACNNRLQKLKIVLPKVAKDFNVNVGSLANHMAYRLAEQGENWWGAAKNLQHGGRPPFTVARKLLLEHVNLTRLSPFDRELLERALEEK